MNNHGAVPVNVPHRMTGDMAVTSMGTFSGARSPPSGKNKDLSHVPCKFFRQGQCQAGRGCAYSHTFEKSAPCKYFLKGNCKFGLKCANEHILRDGTIASRPGYRPPNILMGQVNGGDHRRTANSHGQPLSPSLMGMDQQFLIQSHHDGGMQPLPSDEYNYQAAPLPAATADITITSHPGSHYGSPANDRGTLGMSPVLHGLSIADVQLPASFDSQGISMYARNGPMAASVPSKFGFDGMSPPSSLPRPQIYESSALQKLRYSAFANEKRAGAAPLNGFIGSSPPTAVEETMSHRIMHSERYAHNPRLNGLGAVPGISSSLPGGRSIPIPRQRSSYKDEELDGDLLFSEEDAVPKSLHEDILTPDEQEKSNRRLSGRYGEPEFGDGGPGYRHSLNALAQPGLGSFNHASPNASGGNSLVGSPSGASRFSALFNETNVRGPSVFGHVGSPLRNSSLNHATSQASSEAKRPRPNSTGSALGTDTASTFNGLITVVDEQANVGMLSQQLHQTHLGSPGRENNSMQGLPQRPFIGTRLSADGQSRLPSSSSSAALGKGRDRIDEEQPEQVGMFDMEGLEDSPGANSGGLTADGIPGSRMKRSGLKRLSGGNGWGFFGSNRSAPKVELNDGSLTR